jgi:hypothetical protein
MNALRHHLTHIAVADLWLAAGLIGLDVVARLLPHPQIFGPSLATALLGGLWIVRSRRTPALPATAHL